MKTAIALAGSLALAGPACADLVNVFWQDMENSHPDRWTYRLFAQFDDLTDRIGAYAGLEGAPLFWYTSAPSGIINDDGYWEGPDHLNDLPYGTLPNIEQDTWLTIGYVGDFDYFPAFSPEFLGTDYNDPANLIQVLVDGMTSFSHDDSAVFVVGHDCRVDTWDSEGPLYDVALAQFTVGPHDGVAVAMGGVIQWADFEGHPVQTEFFAIVPAPGALPLTAVGFLMRRRRR